MQKAALEALATFCGKHPNVVAGTTTKVIHVPVQHTVSCVEREACLPAQGNYHYSLDLITSVRFSEAMMTPIDGWWEKVYSIDTKCIGIELKKWITPLKH
jgi:hypothetical protein